ncbi:GGDEF domain-containing protein [Marinicella sp. S1101]|uniref:ligand-binding sensor domain-containing diguanylate cyclase n=1 Tax=Marinicella marina TaxID=2996016 RepID=UPI002260BABE|nr:GGDEF domain-containing protein [Marinicella marina]MCX7554583.1 GGDEF domain-containing protein [Marinicella marina]MDJ1141033.1 GGDEF domain-containing protein [Marinicella marina]
MAEIVGRPPIVEIEIPSEPYVSYFDMTQDHNNVIYISYEKGIKIFDGSRWTTLLIPNTYLTRILYFDQKDRVYVGGFDFFGYINRNQFGQYEFIDLTPKSNPIQFASIWSIAGCQGRIFFRALNHVFAYEPNSGDIISWSFNGRLGDIACDDQRIWLQDRSAGMKELSGDQWVNSPIELEDNSLIYELEILNDSQIFIHSLSDNWRLIENDQIKPISFASQLPELGSFASSLNLGENQVVMGGKLGSLTFLDFNNFTTESFKLSNGRISAIIPANDGGLWVLTDLKIFHVTWPSPWRIQDSESGLTSDIFDITTWNDQLYATSRAGVFVEDSNQSAQQQSFKQLPWTNQEAWNLLPLNTEEILLADSHYAYLIKGDERLALTDVIYPRVFQRSKFNPNHIYMYTELDTRLLIKNGDDWSDWVVAEGKPSSVVETEADTLLITTVDGRFFKVLLNQQYDGTEAIIDMSNQAEMSAKEMTELKLFEGPDKNLFAATTESYYTYENNQFIPSSLMGLDQVLPPAQFTAMGASNESFWAISATQVFTRNQQNQWQTVDASAHIRGGIFDIEFQPDQIKLSGNGVILSYLLDTGMSPADPNGKLIITSAELNTNQINDESPRSTMIPIMRNEPFAVSSSDGTLTIQYTFTDIKNTGDTQYQYRLKGHNNLWSPMSSNTQASFLELPAGDYQFEVRAADIKGQIHTSQLLPFTVEPVWYLTQWAKLIWSLLAVITLFICMKLILKWRERKHESQKQALKEIINEKTSALKLANEALQDLAHKDPLTGLSNRLYLDQFIKQLIENKVSSISVIMMDMDHFKKYNDTYGHLAGDQLLEKFADSLMTCIKRPQDLAARYGGEEFLAIMPGTDEDYTLEAAEKIRSHTEQQAEKTTISIGVAFSQTGQIINSSKQIFELIDQADKALYEAKTTGRNQVVVYSESLETTD